MQQNVGIIGGGEGCLNISRLFHQSNEYRIVVICDKNPLAPAILYAKENNIRTVSNIELVFNLNIDIMLELTGKRADVMERIYANKPDHITLIDSDGAKLFFTLFSKIWEEKSKSVNSLIDRSVQGIERSHDKYESVNSKISILSINASIEAKRVGNEGRGFAVVAKAINDLVAQNELITKEVKDELQSINQLKQEFLNSINLLGN